MTRTDAEPRPRTLWRTLGRPPWRYLFSLWPLRALGYLLISAALGLILIPLSVVFVLFLPLQGILLGHLERVRVRIVGGQRIRSPHVPLRRDEWRAWLGVRLGEPGTWRELVYLVVSLVLGVLSFVLLCALATALVLPVALTYQLSIRPNLRINLFGDVYTEATPQAIIVAIAVTLAALVVGLYLVGLLAAGQGALARLLLSPREEELSRQVARLTLSRVSLVDAFESERRRIERELHDGVQQRLVSLTMKLGLAELDLAAAGPAAAHARSAVADAHAQAEDALAELRRTVRGIHPQVLADHGLEAAVGEIAAHSPVPVTVGFGAAGLGRLPSPVEAAAYFTVSEALSNVLRHAGATRIRIEGARSATELTVTVEDDGNGGANAEAGTGLTGLAQRADALGGSLEVSSPVGGPTRLSLRLPTVLTSGG